MTKENPPSPGVAMSTARETEAAIVTVDPEDGSISVFCRLRNAHCDDPNCEDYGCALQAGVIPQDMEDDGP